MLASAALTRPRRADSRLSRPTNGAPSTQLEEQAKAIRRPSACEDLYATGWRQAASRRFARIEGGRRVCGADCHRVRGLDTHIENYEALIPYPQRARWRWPRPVQFRAELAEPAIPGRSRYTSTRGQLPTFNAYPASGDVTAPLVYVNYGQPEDYEYLKKQGVDVKGKIVIARYGRSWRGTKPKVAQENGAVGCLIYSDPREDGFFQSDVVSRRAPCVRPTACSAAA